MAGQTPLAAWHEILARTAELTSKLRLLIRVANHTNQVPLARSLLEALRTAPSNDVTIAVLSKPENGAVLVREELSRSDLNIHALNFEVPAYSDITSEALSRVRACDVILLVVSAAAPLFDETTEFLTRELASVKEEIVLVVVSVHPETAPLESPVVLELNRAGFTACASSEVVSAVLEAVSRRNGASNLDSLLHKVKRSAQDLLPLANAFANFLSLSQGQYLRRLDFIQRDLNALSALAQQARTLLETTIQKFMGDARTVITAITLSMRQQAEAAIQNTPIPRDVLASMEARTQFGRSAIGSARAAGYREFDLRLEALAMDLNSARSVLLSKMEHLRAEAQAHLEELVLNTGPGLLPLWLRAAGPAWSQDPLDFSLEPGTEFAAKLGTAARQVRSAIAEPQFASAWASRMETLFKQEMTAAANAGWTPVSLDQPLLSAISLLWKDTTERSCGILIGRLAMLVEAVTAGIASTRLASLQLPKDDQNRSMAGHAFRSYAEQLETMIQDKLT